MKFDPLFKGLTRPAMLFGVPLTPLFITFSAIILSAVYFNFFLIILLFPALLILKMLTKKDDFIFRLSFLKMIFFTNPQNRKYFNAKTYSSIRYDKMPKNSGLPRLNLFALSDNPNFEKLLPYSSLISNNVVISKDYLLLASWRLDGISFEVEEDIMLDSKNASLNMLFKSMANEPISYYFHNARHSYEDKFQATFQSSYLKDINDKYFDTFKKGTLQKNSLFFTIIYNPISKIEKSTFKKMSLENKQKEIKVYLHKFEEYTSRIESNLKRFRPYRLQVYERNGAKYSSQLEFYNFLIGGKFLPVRVSNAPINEYLGGGLKNIQFNHDMAQLNFNDDTKKFARAIEIKDYSSETFAGILDTLMYLKINYTITQSFSPLSRSEGKQALDRQRKQLIASEDDSLSQVEQLNEALDNLASGELCFGKYHFSIIVFGDSIKDAQANANILISTLNDLGFSTTLASIALPATYFAQFPCNFAIRPRINLISSANFSSLIALHNFDMGKRDNNCWGEATTMLKTPNGQPYYLNFHQSTKKDDFGKFYLGNTLVLGMSGGGKTVFMNFLVCQMMKYANKNTFPATIPDEAKKFTLIYLDKDKGALANILCAGGRYISIENGKPTGFNPFMVETNQNNLRFLQSLMKLCVTRNGEILNTKEEKKLNDAINFIMTQFKISERKYPISLLLENITEDINDNNSLKSRLNMFKKGNQFGWVFDNENDILDFPDNINIYGIDGTEFLDDKDVSAILCHFILWRVMDLADGRRFVLDIDEAWKWLENDVVADEVKNKFKTIRKQNGLLRLATQSVEDFLKLKIAKALVEQSATMIFLPNPKAQREDYVKGLNLSDDEYEIVRDFDVSSFQFLVKRGDEKVICKLDLSSIGDSNLKILSTGSAYIDVIEEIFAQENKSLNQKIQELKIKFEEE